MKKADKSKARYTVIFGEEELSKNQVTVKDMENSNQFLIDLDKLENFITSCQA
jgi:histidyl-tRNA synthetase